MNIPIMTLPGYEADDILGTLAKKNAANGVEVSVVSGDRDLLQLADAHIKIRIPKTSRGGTEIHDYYPEDVKREYQVTPIEFIDVKALMGDASDNIPGVPSIGEKTATNLIVAYGSIENAYAHLSEIKPPRAQKALAEHYDLAQMSKELATICIDCPVEFSYADMEVGNLYTQEAYEYMKRLEFKSILARFDADHMAAPDVASNFQVIRDFGQARRFLQKRRKRKIWDAAGSGTGTDLRTGSVLWRGGSLWHCRRGLSDGAVSCGYDEPPGEKGRSCLGIGSEKTASLSGGGGRQRCP